MAKGDPKQDYYADLGLQPGADTAEVKKAFRNLAKLYHPDRNRGNELEANIKFQAIQSANEILTDPEKRLKWEADRAKTARQAQWSAAAAAARPAASPVPAASNFPPPPRRTQPNPSPYAPRTGVPPTAKKTGTTADRYTQYTNRNFAPQADRSRAQTAKAWAEMKRNQAAGQQQQQQRRPEPPPRPPRPTSYAAPGPSPKAKGGWDEPPPQQQPSPAAGNYQPRASMPGNEPAQSPRRPGFFPGTGAGNEPPVTRQQSAYYNMQQRPRPQSTYIPPTSAVHPGVRHVDPRVEGLKGFMPKPQEDTYGDRVSTPYATSGGEKTYFSSEGLSRSASTGSNLHKGWGTQPDTQPAPKSPDRSDGFRHARRRSASPLRSSQPADLSDSSSSSFSSEDDEPAAMPRPKLQPKSRAARRASAGEGRAQRPGTGAFQPPNGPEVRVEVEDGSPRPRRPPHRSTTSDDLDKTPRENNQYRRKSSGGATPAGFQPHRLRVSPGRGGAGSTSLTPPRSKPGSSYSNGQPLPTPKDWHEKFGAAENTRHYERPAVSGDGKGKPSGSFFFANDSSASTSEKNSSAENVGGKGFSASDWHGTFDNTNEYFSPRPGSRPTRRGRSPTKSKGSGGTGAKPVVPPRPSTDQSGRQANGAAAPPPQPSPAKFSSEEWSRHFKESEWYTPNTAPLQGSASASKPKGRLRKGSQARKKPGVTPVPVTVTTGEEQDAKEIDPARLQKRRGPLQPASPVQSPGSNGSAMDLDEEILTPPPPVDPDAQCMQERSDPLQRIISSAMPGGRPYSAHQDDAPPPKVPPKDPLSASDLEDFSDDALGDLDDLADTEPLGPSHSGLAGMSELATMLPFASQPSSAPSPSTRRAVVARDLEVPEPPAVPAAPKELGAAPLSRGAWEAYVSQVDGYLGEWHAYNARVLSHFVARREWSQERLPRGWTTSADDAGLAMYAAGLEEDRRVRERWQEAWDGHSEALKGFARVRRAAADADLLEDGLTDAR